MDFSNNLFALLEESKNMGQEQKKEENTRRPVERANSAPRRPQEEKEKPQNSSDRQSALNERGKDPRQERAGDNNKNTGEQNGGQELRHEGRNNRRPARADAPWRKSLDEFDRENGFPTEGERTCSEQKNAPSESDKGRLPDEPVTATVPTIPDIPVIDEKAAAGENGKSMQDLIKEQPAVNTSGMAGHGMRISLTETAALLKCDPDELKDITDLLNEYLTVKRTKKNGQEEYLYNHFDIERLRQFIQDMYQQVGLSDEMMLEYADRNFTKPYDESMQEITAIPAHIEDSVRNLLSQYTYEIRASLTPLLQNVAGYMADTNKHLQQQQAMIESGKALLDEQQAAINELSSRIEQSTGKIRNIEHIASENGNSLAEQGQSIELVMQQAKTSQGATIKAINSVSELINELRGSDSGSEGYDDTRLVKKLEELLQLQKEQRKKLDGISADVNDAAQAAAEQAQAAAEQTRQAAEQQAMLTAQPSEELQEELDSLRAKLEESEQKLAESEQRLSAAASEKEAMAEKQEKLGNVIRNIGALSDQKDDTIDSLHEQVASLTAALEEARNMGAARQAEVRVDTSYEEPEMRHSPYRSSEVSGGDSGYDDAYSAFQPKHVRVDDEDDFADDDDEPEDEPQPQQKAERRSFSGKPKVVIEDLDDEPLKPKKNSKKRHTDEDDDEEDDEERIVTDKKKKRGFGFFQ